MQISYQVNIMSALIAYIGGKDNQLKLLVFYTSLPRKVPSLVHFESNVKKKRHLYWHKLKNSKKNTLAVDDKCVCIVMVT